MKTESNAESTFGKEPSPMAYENRPKKPKDGREMVNHSSLSPVLLDTINLDNLYQASQEVRRGVNWKDSVQGFQANLISNLVRIRQEVLTKKYRIRPYKCFTIHEPKERAIEATCHRDRVFQRTLCNVYLYHQLTKHFIYDNGANQKGKGTDFTHDRLKTQLHRHWLKNGLEGFVAYVDITKFFRFDTARYCAGSG